MLTRRIIACLDCRDGRVVKGVQFRALRDVGSPVSCAEVYQVQGADEIALLDVSATPRARAHHLESVRRVRDVLSIPLLVGGGIRTVDDARAVLEAGADKVAVNTAAVQTPELISQLTGYFGRQCTVLAVDAARNGDSDWHVMVRSGQRRIQRNAVAWCQEGADRGAGEILLTSWDRDGTRQGYEVNLLADVARAVEVPVIASGGAAEPAHLLAALQAGADAVLAASIFHDGQYTVQQVKAYLANHDMEIRQ